MFTSILILTVSVVLLVYWFRYCCLALLRNSGDEPSLIAENGFRFQDVRRRLYSEPDLDALHQVLDRDYRLVTYLLQHAAALGEHTVERRILLLDYKLMQGWYRFTRTVAPAQARKALGERAAILGCLAQQMSEHAGAQTEA